MHKQTTQSELTVAQLWVRRNRASILAMLAARKHAAAERARVDAYIEPIFRAHRFINDEDGKLIADAKHLYLCQDEEEVAKFYAESDAAHRAHGFTGPAGNCPALTAEHEAVLAENVVVRSTEKLLGVEVIHMDHRTKLLDLVVAMVEGK